MNDERRLWRPLSVVRGTERYAYGWRKKGERKVNFWHAAGMKCDSRFVDSLLPMYLWYIYMLTHNWLYWHSAETHNTHDKSRIFNPHQQYYCDASKIEFFAGCMFTPIRIACSITSIRFFFLIRLNYTFTAVVPLDYNVLIDLTVEKNKISHRILILHVYRWRSN